MDIKFKATMNYKILLISFIFQFALMCISCNNQVELRTYDFPGGLKSTSADYPVSIDQGN